MCPTRWALLATENSHLLQKCDVPEPWGRFQHKLSAWLSSGRLMHFLLDVTPLPEQGMSPQPTEGANVAVIHASHLRAQNQISQHVAAMQTTWTEKSFAV